MSALCHLETLWFFRYFQEKNLAPTPSFLSKLSRKKSDTFPWNSGLIYNFFLYWPLLESCSSIISSPKGILSNFFLKNYQIGEIFVYTLWRKCLLICFVATYICIYMELTCQCKKKKSQNTFYYKKLTQ